MFNDFTVVLVDTKLTTHISQKPQKKIDIDFIAGIILIEYESARMSFNLALITMSNKKNTIIRFVLFTGFSGYSWF